ncbi:MAG: hypothetical protein H6706_24390 [Myxococcales bacterium]|nr:hypothetical protein [Myxococcales bacterium]
MAEHPAGPAWPDALRAARARLEANPRDAAAWLDASAALGAGEQWAACFQTAGQAVQLAPHEVAGWSFLLLAAAQVEQPPPVSLLADAVRLHGADDGLVAAVAELITLLPTDDLFPLSAALLHHGRALEVLRLAHLAPAALAEHGLVAARLTDDPAQMADWATRLIATHPDHEAARATLAELAHRAGDVEAAVALGEALLGGAPAAVDQLLLARGLRAVGRAEDADLLVELHRDRPGAEEEMQALADRLGVGADDATRGSLALLQAALAAGRWPMALLAAADLAPDGALWDALADVLTDLHRPLEAAAARVVARGPA